MNLLAILVAGLAAVVISTAYYMAFARQMSTLHPAYADPNAKPGAGRVVAEILRSLILAAVVAMLANGLHAANFADAAGLALILWVGFPLVLWTGACVWERVSPKLAAIHAGDWLLKLLVVTSIVSLWR